MYFYSYLTFATLKYQPFHLPSAAIISHDIGEIKDGLFRTSISVHRLIDCSKTWPRSLTPTPPSGTPPTYQAVDGRVIINHHPRLLKVSFRVPFPRRPIFQTHFHLPLLPTQTSPTTMMMLQSSQSTSKKYMVLANFSSPNPVIVL